MPPPAPIPLLPALLLSAAAALALPLAAADAPATAAAKAKAAKAKAKVVDPAAIVPLKDATFFLAEDFEDTEAGKIPAGFTARGAVAVVDDVAHTGRKALRLDAAVKGERQLVKEGKELTAMGGQHWGRLFYKVQLPSPLPAGDGGVHSNLVVGFARSPLDDDRIEVRLMGTHTADDGTFHYLYNVQPYGDHGGRPEFGAFGKDAYHYTDAWTLAEWYVDHATQSYRFFVNGTELTDLAVAKGAGNFAGAEIPAVFTSLAFGWQNYQPVAGAGFVVWLDDLALTKERIGDQTRLPVVPPGKAKPKKK